MDLPHRQDLHPDYYVLNNVINYILFFFFPSSFITNTKQQVLSAHRAVHQRNKFGKKHFLKYLQLKVLEHLELALISLFMNDNSVAILMELKLKATDALKDNLLLKLFYNNSIPNRI